MIRNLFIVAFIILNVSCSKSESKDDVPEKVVQNDTINIISFNMWHGGDAGGQPLTKSIEVIRSVKGGIVGVQESAGYGDPRPDNSAIIAGNMGWRQFDQGSYDGIMTKYQIVETLPSKRGAKIKIDEDKFIWFFNCHFAYIPYQPYQLGHKKYGDYPFIDTEEEAIKWAEDTRLHQLEAFLKEMEQVADEGWPVVLTGDFNEPSHQDWTQKAADAGIVQLKVEWPCTKLLVDNGYIDAYRNANKDEVNKPGKTWSSIQTPGEIHDRIDFIFYKGYQLQLTGANTIGEKSGLSDIGIELYPSDHRAVVASFIWADE